MQDEQKDENAEGIPEGVSEITFIPTLHPGMEEYYRPKKPSPKPEEPQTKEGKKFTELTIQDVAEMTDEQVYQLSIPRPFHPEQRGFMWPGPDVASGKIKTEVMFALIKRLRIPKQEGSK